MRFYRRENEFTGEPEGGLLCSQCAQYGDPALAEIVYPDPTKECLICGYPVSTVANPQTLRRPGVSENSLPSPIPLP